MSADETPGSVRIAASRAIGATRAIGTAAAVASPRRAPISGPSPGSGWAPLASARPPSDPLRLTFFKNGAKASIRGLLGTFLAFVLRVLPVEPDHTLPKRLPVDAFAPFLDIAPAVTRPWPPGRHESVAPTSAQSRGPGSQPRAHGTPQAQAPQQAHLLHQATERPPNAHRAQGPLLSLLPCCWFLAPRSALRLALRPAPSLVPRLFGLCSTPRSLPGARSRDRTRRRQPRGGCR